jgi:hypothetical protein
VGWHLCFSFGALDSGDNREQGSRAAPAAPPRLLTLTPPPPPTHTHRTAGRTFHSCLLRAGTPPALRCPKAYDTLRTADLPPDCRLVSSHDDFSAVQDLPAPNSSAGGVAVVTQLRDPLQRVLSAYEFGVEVGAPAGGGVVGHA